MTGITTQYLLACVALGAGTAVAIVFAGWRERRLDLLEQQPQEDDDVGIYDEQIVGEQEKNHKELVEKIRAKARELASGGREITTDDIHEAMPIPDGVDGRILGTAFFPRKDWMKVGYTPSRRKENHSRPVSRWSLRPQETA